MFKTPETEIKNQINKHQISRKHLDDKTKKLIEIMLELMPPVLKTFY